MTSGHFSCRRTLRDFPATCRQPRLEWEQLSRQVGLHSRCRSLPPLLVLSLISPVPAGRMHELLVSSGVKASKALWLVGCAGRQWSSLLPSAIPFLRVPPGLTFLTPKDCSFHLIAFLVYLCRIFVNMDDNIIEHYTNQLAFQIEISEVSGQFQVTLVEV